MKRGKGLRGWKEIGGGDQVKGTPPEICWPYVTADNTTRTMGFFFDISFIAA